MDCNDLDIRLRNLEDKVKDLVDESIKLAHLSTKTSSQVLEIVSALRGAFGGQGLIAQVYEMQKNYTAQIEDIKKRQYIFVGIVTAIATFLPIIINFIK